MAEANNPISGSPREYLAIPLGKLIVADCPPPDARMRASIAQWGQFEDVIVRPHRDKFKVLAGNRRVRAIARVAADEEREPNTEIVYCQVERDLERALAIMVGSNNMRRSNPLTDLAAIVALTERLIKKGKNQKEIERHITKELGLSAGTQRKRLKLKSLNVAFREAVVERRMTVAVAERVAVMHADEQQEVLALLEEKGSVTAKDVRELRMRDTLKVMAKLPWEASDALEGERS